MNVLYKFPQLNEVSGSNDGPRKKRRGMMIFGIFFTLSMTILFIGWSDASTSDETPGMSVRDVTSMIVETATNRPENSIHPNGGVLGSWWIYAMESSGDSLIGLCLESKEMHIGASRAVIKIDSKDDSLSFILENAVVAFLPNGHNEGSLEQHDSLKIGPIPLTINVVDDDQHSQLSLADVSVAKESKHMAVGY